MKIIRNRGFLWSAVAAALAIGCGGAGAKAPAGPDGRPMAVLVRIDRGTPGRAVLPGEVPREAVIEERNAFAAWMENDLAALLNGSGYAASLLRPDEERPAGPGSCRLQIVLRSYVPASRASRTEAGLGEGVSAVEIDYELFFGQGGKERRLFSNSRAMSSGRNWEWLAHALNEEIAKAVTRRLGDLRQ